MCFGHATRKQAHEHKILRVRAHGDIEPRVTILLGLIPKAPLFGCHFGLS
jgi:hypothetical protein